MSPDITTQLVKELRDATGVSVMQCKNALTEAGGDMNKALAILKKVSSDVAMKKADRIAKDGRVIIKTTSGKAVLIALHCETDFVSKNEDFVKLLDNLADIALVKGIASMKDESKPMIDLVIQKTGEKIELGGTYEVIGDILGTYVHGNKSGVIVSLSGGNVELAKDLAMQATAMKPEFISKDEITPDAKKIVSEIFEREVNESNKPEEIKKKILEGKISTYFKERTLTDQAFIKNGEETINSLLDKNKASIKEIKRYFI